MTLPTQFEAELREAFHNRFRLRWSEKRREFHLEQKVYTGQILPPPENEDGTFDTQSDEWIRARDGYFYIMTITVGDRMPCPVCHTTLKVPVMETAEVVCHECKSHGIDGRYLAAYFPLNQVLLDHIRFIDPETGGPRRVWERIRAKRVEEIRQRQLASELDDVDSYVREDVNQLEHRPMVGAGSVNKSRNVMEW